ncbi:MAG TPA: hypothetical protein VIG28_06380, partial [Leifsonia sp.]
MIDCDAGRTRVVRRAIFARCDSVTPVLRVDSGERGGRMGVPDAVPDGPPEEPALLTHRSAIDLARAIRRREVSSVEVVEAHIAVLERIRERNALAA